MVLLRSCNSPAKSAVLYDIQAEHLLSMPIMTDSVSYCWMGLVVRAAGVDSTLNTVSLQTVSLLLNVYSL